MLAQQLTETRFLSREWIYNNIFEVSDEEIVIEQDKILDDLKFEANLQKIMQEAMQPPQPGGAPGAPMEQVEEDSDIFGAEESVNGVADLLKKTEARGRPREGLKYGSDKARGGRDPMGYKEIMAALDVHYKNRPSGRAGVTPGIREDLSALEQKFNLKPKGEKSESQQILND